MEQIRVEELFDLTHSLAATMLRMKQYPWEALGEISEFIISLGATLSEDEFEQRGENIWVARDAKIAPSAYLSGPLIIGHKTEVRHCAYIRGSALVGDGAVIGNSTELKNCILFDRAQVPHFNYVGDSILGYRAHMGAGSITSNVRSDNKNIIVHSASGPVETGRRKFGVMLGDFVEVGCNSVLNPGTVIGRNSIIYPTSCVRGVVPEASIYKNSGVIIARKMEDKA